jgi:hypothetical protein
MYSEVGKTEKEEAMAYFMKFPHSGRRKQREKKWDCPVSSRWLRNTNAALLFEVIFLVKMMYGV